MSNQSLAASLAARLVNSFLYGSLGKLGGVAFDAFFELVPPSSQMGPIRPPDERIKRLDDARDALKESLAAIDQLQAEAAHSEALHAQALAALQVTLDSKESAEQKLLAVEGLVNANMSILRDAVGANELKKERYVGFFIGVLASLAAAAIIAIGGLILKNWLNIWEWALGLVG